MKRFLFSLLSLFFISNAHASELKESTMFSKGNFETLNTQSSARPEVIEFFSFYCSHCYNFEYQYNIPKQLKETLPKDAEFKQIHIGWDENHQALAHAWVLAQELQVQDKVKRPLFEAAQAASMRNTPLTVEDIRQVLLNNGVTAQQYDDYISSFKVINQLNYQLKLATTLGVKATPDIYVNGKYHVLSEGLDQNNYAKDLISVIHALLKK